ncbi:hypothetical protein [Sulfodiicoccus acidiphilus]|nr:hypothetical protein [Sulfodiicoccus acidiphilus]
MYFVPPSRLVTLQKMYSTTFSNWPSVMLGMLFERPRITCRFRNGAVRTMTPDEVQRVKRLKVTNIEDDLLEFDYVKRLKFHGWRLG